VVPLDLHVALIRCYLVRLSPCYFHPEYLLPGLWFLVQNIFRGQQIKPTWSAITYQMMAIRCQKAMKSVIERECENIEKKAKVEMSTTQLPPKDHSNDISFFGEAEPTCCSVVLVDSTNITLFFSISFAVRLVTMSFSFCPVK
jgi:hypothetical protein